MMSVRRSIGGKMLRLICLVYLSYSALTIVLTPVRLCDDSVTAFALKFYWEGEYLKVVYPICCGVDLVSSLLPFTAFTHLVLAMVTRIFRSSRILNTGTQYFPVDSMQTSRQLFA